MRSLLGGGAAVAVMLVSGVAAHAAPASTAGPAATAAPEYKKPKIFGTTFQTDPGHDFTKGIHSRRDGVLRGWITYVGAGTAEYAPIRWKKGTHTEGRFVGQPEGSVTAFASPIAKNVVFLSAYGCKPSMGDMTVSRKTGLGNKKCSRAALIDRAERQRRPALITVHKSRIVQVQEIWTP
ncbi:hypothetical protein ITP53_53475 [Nonomuraea sp. K274]|uniref:Uncharacterized protein n=1 Tax=Nonomuraea cypriaca TaxID=1187855 RepID=A0A931F7L4_9ACTN|nr:hypothetical protein [Nonomuraea cypriaca]MBF8194331.1 hypothetical protein [Nonomuraea cypriaca]